MEFAFTLDTCGTCVGELREELLPLEESAYTWEFPYAIFVVFRVLPESYERRTSRRFDSRDHILYLDISLSYEHYQRLSKNEQREALGIHLYSYLAESIAKYTKHADKTVQDQLLQLVKSWMLANHWLEGKIHQARILLSQEIGLYEVSRIMKMPLEEIEYILLRMNDGATAEVHPDHL